MTFFYPFEKKVLTVTYLQYINIFFTFEKNRDTKTVYRGIGGIMLKKEEQKRLSQCNKFPKKSIIAIFLIGNNSVQKCETGPLLNTSTSYNP